MAQQQCITTLTPRHRRVLSLVAQGLSTAETAEATGLHRSTISTIRHSDAGREALAEMVAEVESELALRLPGLLRQSLDAVEFVLKHPGNHQNRLQAASLVAAISLALAQRKPLELPAPRQGRHETFEADEAEPIGP